MLHRAISHLKTAILQTIHEEPSLAKDSLSFSDWQTLKHIRDFLQGFYDTTKATEGRNAALHKVLPSLDFLVARFEEAIKTYKAQNEQFMISTLQARWSKILKYWNRTERTTVYITAIVLDPTMKWSYFENWQPQMRQKMKDFWELSYRPTALVHERIY